MEAFQKADCIYTYMDYNGEVCMRPLIEEAWRLGKKVAAPKVDGEEMDYYYISSYADVHPGYFHIPEPDAVNPAQDEEALWTFRVSALTQSGIAAATERAFMTVI